MSKLMNRRSASAIIVAAVGVGGLALGLATTGHSTANPPSVRLTAVAPDVLSAAGIQLTAPTAAIPPTAAASAASDAVAVALQALGSRQVLQTVYAHCSVPGMVPPVDKDCWAVSLDPSGYHSHGPGVSIAATYLVAMVDPATGKYLFAEAGAP